MANPLAVLYGKNHERDHIKTLLTSDNVLKKGELYDMEKPCNSTKADDYRDWGVFAKTVSGKQATLSTSIDFGCGSSEKISTQKADYDNKNVAKVPGFKPPNRINIIDLDPAYQTDKSANTSSYATQFDEKALAEHQAKTKVVIHGTGSSVTNYLRATHFTLGSDPTELKTEAQVAYSPADGSQSYTENCLAAERAHRDKCNNSVFRNGDYNDTKGPDNKTVFSMSYAGAPSNQKGYDHIVNSRANIKMDDAKYALSKKLYNYLREKFQNPRDPCQVNLRQAFALFDKNRTGFISYECLSSVLKRLVEPQEQGITNEIISLFDANQDGKIDYLEFENFLNQKFPVVETEESLYTDTYKPSLLEGAAKPRSNEYSPVDGKYHVKTHFRFGEGDEKKESLYKSTFGGEKKVERITVAKPLPASQVLPVEPDHLQTAKSIQRVDFGNHSKDLGRITSEKVATIQANKSQHDNASFHIGQSVDEGKEARTKSLAASSYTPLKLPVRTGRTRGFETQWKHLTTEDTLPDLTKGVMKTEHSDAFDIDGSAAIKDCSTNKHLRTLRVTDEKTSHLCFGSDSNRGDTTEMAVQFQGRSVESGKVPAAGISGGFIPQHQHTHHVDNTAQAGEVNHDMVTVMQSDYKTLDGAIKARPIQGTGISSHYFHMNNSNATPGTTTQHDFTHPVDKLTGLAYQTVASK